MSWDSRQRVMLAEMGFRVPAPPRAAVQTGSAAPDVETAAPADEVAVLERPPATSPRPAPRAPVPAPVAAVEALVAPAPREAAPLLRDLAGLDLDALRDAVLSGQACGGCEHRRHLFGRGALPQADWLIVTDPPDEFDENAGELLGGDAGRLLDRMLLAVGQRLGGDGARAFVAPLVPGRAPRGRPPQPRELDAGEAQLARLVELLQPKLVLAMGLQSARRLTASTEPLGRLRGRVHGWRGLPLVVTYHPAYLLRSPADKAGAWDDLCLARRTLQPT